MWSSRVKSENGLGDGVWTWSNHLSCLLWSAIPSSSFRSSHQIPISTSSFPWCGAPARVSSSSDSSHGVNGHFGKLGLEVDWHRFVAEDSRDLTPLHPWCIDMSWGVESGRMSPSKVKTNPRYLNQVIFFSSWPSNVYGTIGLRAAF